jgi:hypothetical protein
METHGAVVAAASVERGKNVLVAREIMTWGSLLIGKTDRIRHFYVTKPA